MIGEHTLHACSWLAVRCLPWRAVVPTVRVVGRLLPTFTDSTSARRSLRRLRGGTCLTRALATSVRLPGSTIAFGVRREERMLKAHAWVVVGGEPLERGDPSGTVVTSIDLGLASR